MMTTIENYCIDCKTIAQPDCGQRGHVVGTLGCTESTVRQPKQPDWCAQCSGTTHMPWCSKYEESGGGESHQPCQEDWRYVEVGHGAHVAIGKFRLSTHWQGLADSREIREIMRQVVNDHNQHQQCAAQLHFFGNRAEELSSLLAGMTTERDGLREVNKQLVEALRKLGSHGCWCVDYVGGEHESECNAAKTAIEANTALNHAARGEGK